MIKLFPAARGPRTVRHQHAKDTETLATLVNHAHQSGRIATRITVTEKGYTLTTQRPANTSLSMLISLMEETTPQNISPLLQS